jgi:hypothetical protein
MLGEKMRSVDLELEHRITGDQSQVQVKSQATEESAIKSKREFTASVFPRPCWRPRPSETPRRADGSAARAPGHAEPNLAMALPATRGVAASRDVRKGATLNG